MSVLYLFCALFLNGALVHHETESNGNEINVTVESDLLVEEVQTILQPPFDEKDVVRIVNGGGNTLIVKGDCGSGIFSGGRIAYVAIEGRVSVIGFGAASGLIVSKIKSIEYLGHGERWVELKSGLICDSFDG